MGGLRSHQAGAPPLCVPHDCEGRSIETARQAVTEDIFAGDTVFHRSDTASHELQISDNIIRSRCCEFKNTQVSS